MSKWRTQTVHIHDGLPPFWDLTFADGILVFVRFSHEIMRLFGRLGQFFGDAGLKLNAEHRVYHKTSSTPLSFAISKSELLCQQMTFAKPKGVHQNKFEFSSMPS